MCWKQSKIDLQINIKKSRKRWIEEFKMLLSSLKITFIPEFWRLLNLSLKITSKNNQWKEFILKSQSKYRQSKSDKCRIQKIQSDFSVK